MVVLSKEELDAYLCSVGKDAYFNGVASYKGESSTVKVSSYVRVKEEWLGILSREQFKDTGKVDRLTFTMIYDFHMWGCADAIYDLYGAKTPLFKGSCSKGCPICQEVYQDAEGLPKIVSIEDALHAKVNLVNEPWESLLCSAETTKPSDFTIGSPHWWCDSHLQPILR